MPGKTKAPAASEPLSTAIPRIFEQAQSSTANHQKNFIALNKIHTEAAERVESVNNGKSMKLTGEREFEDIFLDMVNRVLPVKKGVTVADRIVKFVGGYVKFINEKVAEQQTDEDEDSTASRFVARVLKYLLKGFVAKDKSVRFRSVHVVAEMVSHLGEIEEDVYMLLRSSLLERIHDKESPVRVQAVIGLSKLCGSEEADGEDEEQTATDVLLEVLSGDTAPEVRRAALLNIPLTPVTLSSILDRTRDVDTMLRKLVYSAILLPQSDSSPGSAIGLGHPRALTIAQRELVVCNGLGDREPAVRAAVAKLLGHWVDAALDSEDADVMLNIIGFLRMFDLSEGTVAEDALLSIFTTRPEMVDDLKFADAYWAETLTPEKAFLVRVFVQHCIAVKDETRLEAALPVVTALAFRIQSAYNDLLQRIQADREDALIQGGAVDEDEERARREEARIDMEFVLGEMLRLAVDLDYGDEIGRRKMYQLVRDMICQDALPEGLVPRCLDVLRILAPNERDLIRMVVEVVHELRDQDNDDEATPTPNDDAETTYTATPAPQRMQQNARKALEDMTPEERARSDAMDMRCLSLCIAMLERVNSTLQENSVLTGILGELIVPSVRRKELAFRERGLTAMGLCSLIHPPLALSSMNLFMGQLAASPPESLKIRVLQIIFDLLMVHDRALVSQETNISEKVVKSLLSMLDDDDSESVQALIVVGLSKLVLSGMVTDESVLRSLFIKFVSPDTADNQELRQCLSYFFPVYCYSLPANQRRMQRLFVPVFNQLATAIQQFQEDDDQSSASSVVSTAQIATMFVDWTDPQKAIGAPGQFKDETIHFDLATEVVKLLFSDDLQREDKKALCQMFSKLYIPEAVDDDKIRTLKLLIHNLRLRRPIRDTTAKNAFTKFDTQITKKFQKQLEDFSEEEYRKLENLTELFEFLDDIIPEDDVEEDEPKKRATRKRRSESVATAGSTGDEGSTQGTPQPARGKPGRKRSAKRPRLSNSDDDDDQEPERGTPPPRRMPKRAAANKPARPIQKIEESSEEEDDDEDATPGPGTKKEQPLVRARQKKEEAQLDEEIDGLLESDEEPQDSILGSDEE